MTDLIEHSFTCPACWVTISMLLDLSEGAQTFVEDCEVCCRPLLISFDTKAGELGEFDARLDD
jgi:predicted DsbA family dithiol-disulfide isomerase